MKTATFIKDVSEKFDFEGEAILFKLEPPVPYRVNGIEHMTEYVVSHDNLEEEEPYTHVLPSDKDGNVFWPLLWESWNPIGCYLALHYMGYDVDES